MATELLFPILVAVIVLPFLFASKSISIANKIIAFLLFLMVCGFWYGVLQETILSILQKPLPPILDMLKEATNFAMSGLLWLYPALWIVIVTAAETGLKARILLALHVWTIFIFILRGILILL
ncbi:MAG: hypothetical protein D6767_08675 [Candidatus Hydrogenedentota bacterium]|nr:MAG: hypothetical protein D6767_08675 [Candidatus Hydrogenedentota bacterium]